MSRHERMRELLARTREIRARARACQVSGATLKIVVHGEINESTEAQVRAWLAANLHVKEIELVVDSAGGDLRSAQNIYAALRGSGKRITTIAAGLCYSAATVLLLAGDHRKARREARLLLHAPAAILRENESRLTADNLREKVIALDFSTRKLAKLYAARSKRDVGFYMTVMKDDRETTLNDAVAYGLVHEVEGVTEWRGGRPYTQPENLTASETQRTAARKYLARQAEMRGAALRQFFGGGMGWPGGNSRHSRIFC